MNALFLMSARVISMALPNATSSQVLERSRKLYGLLVGRTIVLSGQGLVPANLSPQRAQEAGLLTSGTYGRRSTISFASDALRSSLASRLRRRTDLLGSTLFKLIWKVRTTPAGRSIPALRASVLRTSGNGSTGPESTLSSWPTAIAADGRGSPCGSGKSELTAAAPLAHWPTTTGSDAHSSGSLGYGGQEFMTLTDAASMASWATPAARDYRFANAVPGAERGRRPSSGEQLPNQVVHLASWQTPRAEDAESAGIRHSRGRFDTLTAQTSLLGPARLTALGEVLIGSSAGMGNGGQLSPAHSRWLLSLPSSWDLAAPSQERAGRRC